MSKYHHITVDFQLTEDQHAKLEQLTKRWNAKISACQDPESLFRMIMQEGSKYLIDSKLDLWERIIS